MSDAFSLKARLRSFGYALAGIRTLVVEQHNARIHLLATLVVLMAGYWFGLSVAEWLAILLAVALVWLAEGINTALEYLADAVHPQEHELVGKAKDVAAGSVLICAIIAVVIGVMVFGPYVLDLVATHER